MLKKWCIQLVILSTFTLFLLLLMSAGMAARVSANQTTSLSTALVAAATPVPTCSAFTNFNPNNFPNPIQIDNQWLPLEPGMQFTLEGHANRTGQVLPHKDIFIVTDLTKVINGVRAIVVWDRDIYIDQVQEAELAFFAQDKDGNVWGLGEYPEEYTNGKFTGAPSTWISGQANAQAGLAIVANPQVGMAAYQQGKATSVGFYDCAQPFATGLTATVPAGAYQNVLETDEWSPLDPASGHQRKYYAPGVGNVQIEAVGDPEAETMVLLSAVHLNAAAVAQASAEALKLDTHGYQVSSVYKKTPQSVRSPEIVHYALTVNKVGNGAVALNPPGGVYSPGTIVQLKATPDNGFTFASWRGVATTVTNPLTVTITGDSVVTATFTATPPPPNYTLTVNKTGNGTIALTPPGGVYPTGTVVQLSAKPDTGFTFTGWTGDLIGATTPLTVTLDGNKVVTATFTATPPPPNYTLTVNKTGNGTIALTPPGGVYPAGTVVQLSATPDTGFTFTGWTGDLIGATTPLTVTLDGNKVVTATFTAVPPPTYTLTVNKTGNGVVILVPPGGVYPAGTIVQLHIIPDPGFTFAGWSGDVTGVADSIKITIDGNRAVTAIFTPEILPPKKLYLPLIQR